MKRGRRIKSERNVRVFGAIAAAGAEGAKRQDLARALELTPKRVSVAGNALKAAGLVRATGFGRSARFVVVPGALIVTPRRAAAPAPSVANASDRELVNAWLARNKPTQCPGFGSSRPLPHYDDRVTGIRHKSAISFQNFRERERFARAAALRQARAGA